MARQHGRDRGVTFKDGADLWGEVSARLKTKAIDRALQAQADRLCRVPTISQVPETQIAGMLEASWRVE